MLIAVSISGVKTNAKQADRKMTYICPVCKEKVILKRGKINVPHYAHRQDSQCRSNLEGESLEHMKGKYDLYEWLLRLGLMAELEVYLPAINQRADILFQWKSQYYAIEYQCSAIPPKEVINRTLGYQSIDIKPIWVAGDKLRAGNNLSALNRLFVTESEAMASAHFYYNPVNEVLEVTSMCGAVLNYKKRHRYYVNKYNCIINKSNYDKMNSFVCLDEKDKKKHLLFLHRMRHYNVKQYRTLFELMYTHHLIIDSLPRVVFAEVDGEWTIRTLSIEWKLYMILWLKEYSDTSLLTLETIVSKWQSLIKQKVINCHYLPNLRDNTKTVLCSFIALLEHEQYLTQKGVKRWSINKDKYNW